VTRLTICRMAMLFQFASSGKWSLAANLSACVILIAVRQIWTVMTGMRGLVITDPHRALPPIEEA